jgi:FtsH-binding integral membrane protein
MTSKALNLSRPVIVLILIELIVLAGVRAWDAFAPTTNMSYLVIACPLICLEGLYSARLMRAQKLQASDLIMFRVVELLALGVVLKLVAAFSTSDILLNLPVFDARIAFGAAIAAMFWYSMLDTAYDFKELDNPSPPTIGTNTYISPVDRLTRRFFAGGLLLFAGGVVSTRIGQPTQLVAVFIAYFVIGFILLPSLRFQTEWQRWQMLGIKTRDTMLVPWVRAGLVLVALACIVALLLPTDFGLGLFSTLQSMLLFVMMLVEFVIGLVLWLISLPLRLLFPNLASTPAPFAQPPVSLPMSQTTPTANPLLDLLPKLLLLGLVAYIVVSYFRDHPEFWAMLKKLQIIRFFVSIWQSAWRGTRTLTKDWHIRLPELTLPFRRRGIRSDKPVRLLRFNALSARERILYFYLSTIRRAEEQGLQRAPIQTPQEYNAVLKPALPEVNDELDKLTEAFVEARYSLHPIALDQSRQVQSNWKRIQQALRALHKAD